MEILYDLETTKFDNLGYQIGTCMHGYIISNLVLVKFNFRLRW